MHDTLYAWWCLDKPHLPHSPQACVDRLELRAFFKAVSIHWAIAIIIGVLAFRAVFRYEYVVAHRLCVTIILTHAIRVTTFVATGLPMMNLSCRVKFDRVSNGGGCGDYLFSGHAIVIVVCMLMLLHQRAIAAPRWPLWLLVPLALLFACCVLGYALERWHYTVDILLACLFAPAVWAWTFHLFGPEIVGSRRSWWLPLPAALGGGAKQLTHAVVFTIILGGTGLNAAVGVSVSFAVQLDAVFGALLGLLLTVGGLCLVATEVTHEAGELRTPRFASHPALLCDRVCSCAGGKIHDHLLAPGLDSSKRTSNDRADRGVVRCAAWPGADGRCSGAVEAEGGVVGLRHDGRDGGQDLPLRRHRRARCGGWRGWPCGSEGKEGVVCHTTICIAKTTG